MSDENEVVETPAEEVVVEPVVVEETPGEVQPATEEEGKPVGAATIVEMETPLEQFPAHEDNA